MVEEESFPTPAYNMRHQGHEKMVESRWWVVTFVLELVAGQREALK